MPSARDPSHSKTPSRRLTGIGGMTTILVLVALLLLGLCLAHHSLSNLDIWLHATAGEQILKGQGIPQTNRYSFTAPDHVWIDHEWLFQVLVTLAARSELGPDKAGPWNLLRVFLVGVLLAILLLGEPNTRPLSGGHWRRRLFWLSPVALLTVAMIWTRFILRPELLSYLGFILAVRWIDLATAPRPATDHIKGSFVVRWLSLRSAGGRSVWLTFLWVQLHGFYILVPVMWILALLVAPLNHIYQRLECCRSPQPAMKRQGLRTEWKLWSVCAVSSLGVGILTPNGLEGLLYPLRALGQFGQAEVDFRQVISELAPLLSASDMLGTTIAAFKLSVAWTAIWLIGSCGRVSLLRIVIWAAALAAALHSQRNLGFYALACFMVHSGYRRDYRLWWSRLPLPDSTQWVGHLAARARPLLMGTAVLLTLVVTALWIPVVCNDRFYLAEGVGRRFGAGLTPAHYPFDSIAALQELIPGPDTRTLNNVNSAALLIHAADTRVYIDGRTEAYPTSHWQEYLQLRQGGAEVSPLLARWQPDAVLLAHREASSHGLLLTLLANPAWQVVSADPAGILLLPTTDPESPVLDEVWARANLNLRSRLPQQPGRGAASSAPRSVRAADECLALAGLLKLAGQDSAAYDLFRRGLSYCPEHPVLNHNYGNVLLDRGDFGGALGHFRRALKVNRRLAKTRVNEGICLFRLGNFQAAEESFLAAVGADPRRAEGWVNLAEVRRRRGDRDGALSAYARALELLPHDTRLLERVQAYRAGT